VEQPSYQGRQKSSAAILWNSPVTKVAKNPPPQFCGTAQLPRSPKILRRNFVEQPIEPFSLISLHHSGNDKEKVCQIKKFSAYWHDSWPEANGFFKASHARCPKRENF